MTESPLEASLLEERQWIAASRRARGVGNAAEEHLDLVGLALSCGGYRSAHFAFGVLQGLAQCGLLRGIDYLSSVGGGGYAAAWLLAHTTTETFAGTVQTLRARPTRFPSPPSPRWALRRNVLGNVVALATILIALAVA